MSAKSNNRNVPTGTPVCRAIKGVDCTDHHYAVIGKIWGDGKRPYYFNWNAADRSPAVATVSRDENSSARSGKEGAIRCIGRRYCHRKDISAAVQACIHLLPADSAINGTVHSAGRCSCEYRMVIGIIRRKQHGRCRCRKGAIAPVVAAIGGFVCSTRTNTEKQGPVRCEQGRNGNAYRSGTAADIRGDPLPGSPPVAGTVRTTGISAYENCSIRRELWRYCNGKNVLVGQAAVVLGPVHSTIGTDKKSIIGGPGKNGMVCAELRRPGHRPDTAT